MNHNSSKSKLISLMLTLGHEGRSTYFMLREYVENEPNSEAPYNLPVLAVLTMTDAGVVRRVVEEFGLFFVNEEDQTFTTIENHNQLKLREQRRIWKRNYRQRLKQRKLEAENSQQTSTRHQEDINETSLKPSEQQSVAEVDINKTSVPSEFQEKEETEKTKEKESSPLATPLKEKENKKEKEEKEAVVVEKSVACERAKKYLDYMLQNQVVAKAARDANRLPDDVYRSMLEQTVWQWLAEGFEFTDEQIQSKQTVSHLLNTIRRKARDWHKQYPSARPGELSERISGIKDEILEAVKTYNFITKAEKDAINQFFCYWTAADSAGRMRAEQMGAWHTERSLVSWLKRAKLM